jgi:hypothetical protein
VLNALPVDCGRPRPAVAVPGDAQDSGIVDVCPSITILTGIFSFRRVVEPSAENTESDLHSRTATTIAARENRAF